MIKRLLTIALLGSVLSAKVIMIDSPAAHNKIAKEGIVVTMFTASRCGPCKQIKPYYLSLSDEYDDVTFCIVDVDDSSLQVIHETVKSLPTFIVTHNEKELDRLVGAPPKTTLKSFIDNNRAKALGKKPKEEPVTFLTAEEYSKKGEQYYDELVKRCQQKGIRSAELMNFSQEDDIMKLTEYCRNPQTTEKAFQFMKAYMRGGQRALKAYKPHDKLPDSFVTYCSNYCAFGLSVNSFNELAEWQMKTIRSAQQKAQEQFLEILVPLLAEVSSS